jgi:hypothetical protein
MNGVQPEAIEAAWLIFEEQHAVSRHAVPDQRAGALEINQVNPIGLEMVGKRRQQAVGIEIRVRLEGQIPVRARMRIAACPRPVQRQQSEAGRGLADPPQGCALVV